MGLFDMKTLKISKNQIIETGILFGIISIILGLYTTDKFWLFIAIGVLFVTLLIPSLLKPLAFLWFGLSKGLGWVTSGFVLLVIFWLLVTPIGLIRRVLGKDTLRLRQFKKNVNSAFVERNHEFSLTDLKFPF